MTRTRCESANCPADAVLEMSDESSRASAVQQPIHDNGLQWDATMQRVEEVWPTKSGDEKLAYRCTAWQNPDVEFVGPGAKDNYRARAERINVSMQLLGTPDRVPVLTSVGYLPGRLAGLTPYDCTHNPERAWQAWIDFNLEYQPDGMVSPAGSTLPFRVFEMLDYRLYEWPGHGASKDGGYQYVEREYMPVEDYDALIDDPSDYLLRVYLPKVIGAFRGLGHLGALCGLTSPVFSPSCIGGWGHPEVVEGLEKMAAAGRQMAAWLTRVQGVRERLMAEGFPSTSQLWSQAPFDFIGDTLRGTRGICVDVYRQPERLLEACNRIAPLMVKWVTEQATPSTLPQVLMPLHKGADGFMSDEQFKTFYWPGLRTVILSLIDEGFIPVLFAEGCYDSRLRIISDLPKGRTVWWFDRTDMALAKKTIGQVACIQGNVPVSLAHAGTPQEVTDYCERLIAVAGEDGGFILNFGAAADSGNPECIRAMIQSASNAGTY